MLRNGGDPLGLGGPVFPQAAIAPAYCLHQPTLAVDQGDGHAIHLGLDPEVAALAQPAAQVVEAAQFVQAGLGHGVAELAMAGRQRVANRRRHLGEAVAQLCQAGAGLIVEFVVHRRAPLGVVGQVPLGDLVVEEPQFGAGAVGLPVRAVFGLRGESEAEKGKEGPGLHGEPPCSREGGQSRRRSCWRVLNPLSVRALLVVGRWRGDSPPQGSDLLGADLQKQKAPHAGGAPCRADEAYRPAAVRRASALSVFSQVNAVKVSSP
ncbi:hypothetical protein FQZ97_900630 [compost metagenome]